MQRDRQRGRDDRRARSSKPVDYKPQGADKTEEVEHFKTAGPDVRRRRRARRSQLEEKGVNSAQHLAAGQGRGPLLTFLLGFGPTILFVGL